MEEPLRVNNILYDNTDIEQLNDFAEMSAAIIDQSDIGLFVLDQNSKVISWNQWMANCSEIKTTQALGKTLLQLFPGLSSPRFLNAIEDCVSKGMSSLLSQKFNPHVLPLYQSAAHRKKGQLMYQLVKVKPVSKSDPYALIQVLDVSSAVSRDQMLRRQAEQYRTQDLNTRAILTSIADAVITTDIDGLIDYMNPIAEQMTGWSLVEAKLKPLQQVFKVMTPEGEQEIEPITGNLLNDDYLNIPAQELVLVNRMEDYIAIDRSSAAIKDGNANISGVVVVFRDVSNARELAKQVSWQASHDSLTGLLNRHSFDVKLKEMLEVARSTGSNHALLYLDLDQFKVVNDTCGHVAGDELLRQVSLLIASYIREEDILARLGGDEFGIQLMNCSVENSLSIADAIRRAVGDFRFGWEEKSFSIGVSIGLAEITQSSGNVESLLSSADTACYAAKDNGRNQVHLYKSGASEAALRHSEMEWLTRIQSALDEDRFCLYAQEIYSLSATKHGSHYELLIRMLDKEGEIIAPRAFIPAAERYGIMPLVDRWVVSKALAVITKNIEVLKKGKYQFSINLSGNSLSGEDTLDFICDQLEIHAIPNEMITFEVTETAAISNLSSASNYIKQLKSAGCLFSLDDFGSGLSSFAYLKNLPVDYLKIDAAFVKNMVDDQIDRAMVESINQIGHVMKLKTIAEYVENDAILEELKKIGVDYVQGYVIAKPTLFADTNDNFLLEKEESDQCV